MKILTKAIVCGLALILMSGTGTLGAAAAKPRHYSSSKSLGPEGDLFKFTGISDKDLQKYVPYLLKFRQEVRENFRMPSTLPKEGFIVLGESPVFEEMKNVRERIEIARSLASAKDAYDRIRFENALKGFDLVPQRMQAASMGLVPYRSTAPAFSRNLLLSRDLGTPIQTEPHVCSSPEDRSNVVAAVIDYAQAYTPVYHSSNGGESWRGPIRVPIMNDTYSAGDPVLACYRNKQVSEVFMSLGDWDYVLLGIPMTITRSDIAVSTSTDGGLSWQQPSRVATNLMTYRLIEGEINGKKVKLPIAMVSFLDKPWISAGPNPLDPSKDMVVVTFTAFVDIFGIIDLFNSGLLVFRRLASLESIVKAVSYDAGKTWNREDFKEIARRINFDITQIQAPLKELVTPTVQGSQPAVSKNGTVYVSWYDSTNDGFPYGKFEIHLAVSRDGGKTFSEPMVAAEGLIEPQYSPRSSSFRNIGSRLPHLALGPEGEVYIVVASKTGSKPEDDGDIYFIRGKDDGNTLTFDSPKKVNQDDGSALQFFPAIAVGDQGEIHIAWLDTRLYPDAVKYDTFYTRSTDKGKTFGFEDKERNIKEPDIRISDFYSNPNKGFPGGRFIGDYISVAAGPNGTAYVVWPDTRLAEFGGINQKIAFARTGSIPSPDFNITPSRGPAGQEVTVQAVGFQPDTNVFIQIGSSVIFMGRTAFDDPEGKVSKTFTIPIRGEGGQEVIVYDETGNFKKGSFYVESGFNNLAFSKDLKDTSSTLKKELMDFIKAQIELVLKAGYGILGLLGGLILTAIAVVLFRLFRAVRNRRREENK